MLREFFVCGGCAVLEWMRSDPIGFFQFMLYRAPAVLLALILHEIAHGYVAYRCGDPTARDAGRLSLNPARHLSLIGTLMMFLAGVGWAKPVPVNPNNLRHGRRDDFLVSIAGVTVNFILFTLATVLMCALQRLIWKPELFRLGAPLATHYDFLSFSGENFTNMLFSGEYVITEAAGSQYYVEPVAEYLRAPGLLHVQRFLGQLALCNLGMCLFNLLPIPPLDGFHVFNDILLRGKIRLTGRAFQICMVAMLVLMNATDFFSNIVSKGIDLVQNGVLTVIMRLFGLS